MVRSIGHQLLPQDAVWAHPQLSYPPWGIEDVCPWSTPFLDPSS